MQGSHLRISTAIARQKVNVLMLERVNHLLLSGEPTLVLNVDMARTRRLYLRA